MSVSGSHSIKQLSMSQSSSSTPRRVGPYSPRPDGPRSASVPPVVPASFASQVEQAMSLGHDVQMSVTIEQVGSVPVPDTPAVASEIATPVPVASYYKFCTQCGARSGSVHARYCGECGSSLQTPDMNRHTAQLDSIIKGSLLDSAPAGQPQRETAPAPAVPESPSPQGQLSRALEVLANLWQSRNESPHPFPAAPKSWDLSGQSVSPSPLPLQDLANLAKTEDALFEAACAESLQHPQPVPIGAVSDPPRGRAPVDSWCPPYEPPVARSALDVSHYQVERFGMDQPSNFSSGPTVPRPALPQVPAFPTDSSVVGLPERLDNPGYTGPSFHGSAGVITPPPGLSAQPQLGHPLSGGHSDA